MSFFLSWASLKLLTGSLFCSPSVSMSGISLRLCVGVKRPSMLLLSLLWGSCNSFAVKRTNCYREFYRSVCWWDFLVAYNSPSCAWSWSFHPSCAGIVPGSHLLCSTFCVPVLDISILCFQILSHPLLAHKVHHMPLAGTVCVFCPLHSSWSCVY